jgi:hypothetical protein
VARNAADDGELAIPALAQFPQLIVAPMIMAVIWDGLFGAVKPLDVRGVLSVHRQLLLRSSATRAKSRRATRSL